MFRDLYDHRELIFTLVKRDLKIRYKASTLGFLWSFGRPLFLMLIMWGVFSLIVRIETDIPYGLHLLTGILPWMFFQGAIFEAQASVLANSNVVKKIAVPAAVFPVSSVLSNLVHLFLAMMILAVFILGYGTFLDSDLYPGWEIIFLPAIVVLQCAMLVGIGLILSSLNVYYRDVGSISEILLSAWFYLTPIIYPMQEARSVLSSLGGSNIIYYIYLCNPMTPIIVAYRRVLYGRYLSNAPEISDATLLAGLSLSVIFTITVVWVGSRMFQRLSRGFADEL
ncbi:MAG: ABC transporter permease [Candidatus Sumerlaeia bacterium]|nr:ABC transporter permease [Candidatus Sumerlaeia bacterium]